MELKKDDQQDLVGAASMNWWPKATYGSPVQNWRGPRLQGDGKVASRVLLIAKSATVPSQTRRVPLLQ
jgi:hypothetical protein